MTFEPSFVDYVMRILTVSAEVRVVQRSTFALMGHIRNENGFYMQRAPLAFGEQIVPERFVEFLYMPSRT